ncbi:MAG: response regulator transcription factor [Gammaproteobacteria bacterium]|nr:response regulator transcription factor [Gammaproteobacteria bacterium]MCP5459198.1 response regulator transcription factor [Gammaproteobacteria bacterium]
MNAQTHNVLLVEDDEHTRDRLARVITGHPQLELLAAVESCGAARQVLREHRPHVLLTDLGLPDGNGIELIREVQADAPTTEIMVITVFGDEHHVIGAIEAGASGYLLKDGGADYIGQSIMQMLAGGSPISAAIARHVLRRFQGASEPAPTAPETANVPRLTGREQEVLRLIAKGFSYGEIADMLHVSSHTITTHIKNIYQKLSVRSRGEAVFEAMQMGLLKLDSGR